MHPFLRLSPCKFQSTLPMRGATYLVRIFTRGDGISIHTPHAGSDQGRLLAHGRRDISIHTPHAGSDFAYRFSFSKN